MLIIPIILYLTLLYRYLNTWQTAEMLFTFSMNNSLSTANSLFVIRYCNAPARDFIHGQNNIYIMLLHCSPRNNSQVKADW